MTAFDCDIRPALPSVRDLLPWLDPYWTQMVELRGTGPLHMAEYPASAPVVCRPDWRGGALAGGDPSRVGTEILDPQGSDFAIASLLTGAAHVMNPWYAAALARATNDWLAARWLGVEPRLRGTIAVAATNIPAAVEEIGRLATDPRFVQVGLFCGSEVPLGRMPWWPIYEAAEAADLTIAILPGSAQRHAPTPAGWPSFLAEDHAAQAQAFEMQLLSLICEGVFAKFPKLRVVVVGSGAAWLPGFMWRVTKLWKGTRIETPWIDRPPDEIVRERVFATVTPFDGADHGAALDRLCDGAGSDAMWLAGSACPHWHFDGADPFAGISPAMRRLIREANPRLAHPRLKAPAHA